MPRLPRSFRPIITSLLERGAFDVCFCNEDEAGELMGGGSSAPEAALDYLAEHCKQLAVVTLGEKVMAGRVGSDVGCAASARHALLPVVGLVRLMLCLLVACRAA